MGTWLDRVLKVNREHDQHVSTFTVWMWCAACGESLSVSQKTALRELVEMSHGGLVWVSRTLLA